MRFTVEDIVKVIPHRPPFLLIDSVEVVEFGKSGVGEKKLISDGVFGDFFDSYLPEKRVMPGPMIIEVAAQTAAFVVAAGRHFNTIPAHGHQSNIHPSNAAPQKDKFSNITCTNGKPTQGPNDLSNSMGYLVKIGNFSFDKYAKEGDTLSLHVTLDTVFGALHKFDVKAKISGVEIARGSLTFSVVSKMGSG